MSKTKTPTMAQLARGEALAKRKEALFFLRIDDDTLLELREAGLPCVPVSPPETNNPRVRYHLPKVMGWLQDNLPDLYERARRSAERIEGKIF